MSNKDFKEYIKDKSLCIIGGSPYLKGKCTGEKIDSYDVIIRINSSGLYLMDHTRIDYGYKSNVFYCNDEDAMNGECEYEKLSKMNLDWIIFKTERGYLNFKYKDLIRSTFIIEGDSNINHDDFMGLVAVNHLLYLGSAKEIYATAFSFYTGDEIYCDHYGSINPDPNPAIVHSIQKHRSEFLRLHKEKKIILDDHIIGLL